MAVEVVCEHAWACPNAVTVPQEGGIAIFLPLYCQRCGAAKTLLAPPVEPTPANKIARAQLLPMGSSGAQRR